MATALLRLPACAERVNVSGCYLSRAIGKETFTSADHGRHADHK